MQQPLPTTSGPQHPRSSILKSPLVRPRVVTLTAAVLVLLCLAQHTDALKCYICNNCNKFELSQSRPCPQEQTKCMKMNMETGQVQRSCGTESMCTDSDTELKTRYTAVSCCDQDNCNSAPRTPVPLPPIMAALLLLLLHSHARGQH